MELNRTLKKVSFLNSNYNDYLRRNEWLGSFIHYPIRRMGQRTLGHNNIRFNLRISIHNNRRQFPKIHKALQSRHLIDFPKIIKYNKANRRIQ